MAAAAVAVCWLTALVVAAEPDGLEVVPLGLVPNWLAY